MTDVFILRRGGGEPLNFSVTGGTAEPAAPKENTIWVKTDADITGWVFSPAEPTEPIEGMVWICTALSSRVELEALKKNSITLYPTLCSQYVSGSWVQRELQVYKEGAWKLPGSHVYNQGETELTISFSTNNNSYGSTDNNCITLTSNAVNYNNITLNTTPALDLTDYSLARIELESTGGDNYVGFGTSAGNYSAAQYYFNGSIERKFADIDISALSGSYYFSAFHNWNGVMKIHSIYLM